MTTKESIPYKFIKLCNGDDIVCKVEDVVNSETQIKIIRPLKMQVLPRMMTGADGDSIGLSNWISPWSDSISCQIASKDILLISNASPGLIKYYEYVLGQMKHHEENNALLDDDDDDDEETVEELLEALPVNSKTIH
jgi:hypothetical protein